MVRAGGLEEGGRPRGKTPTQSVLIGGLGGPTDAEGDARTVLNQRNTAAVGETLGCFGENL